MLLYYFHDALDRVRKKHRYLLRGQIFATTIFLKINFHSIINLTIRVSVDRID